MKTFMLRCCDDCDSRLEKTRIYQGTHYYPSTSTIAVYDDTGTLKYFHAKFFTPVGNLAQRIYADMLKGEKAPRSASAHFADDGSFCIATSAQTDCRVLMIVEATPLAENNCDGVYNAGHQYYVIAQDGEEDAGIKYRYVVDNDNDEMYEDLRYFKPVDADAHEYYAKNKIKTIENDDEEEEEEEEEEDSQELMEFLNEQLKFSHRGD